MTQGDLQALQQMMLETINLVVENQINPKLEALSAAQRGIHQVIENQINPKLEALSAAQRGIHLVTENQINPKLEALAEGQQVLLDKLTSEERMEALEMEVELLKIAVRQHSDELAELKMAQ